MAVGNTKVVQVTNIAPQATKDQMSTLFGFLGKIEDIRLYPTIRDVAVPVQSRICYIKFSDPVMVQVAQHLTNTVFIDRALIVMPHPSNDIPDEQKALELTNNGTVVPGLYPSEPKLPANVVNTIEGTPPNHFIATMDPKLEANGLPTYPPLPGHMDCRKIEEIRRTLVIGNLSSTITEAHLVEFFGANGLEVKYVRLCNRDSDKDTYALVEFTEQSTIVPALQLNGQMLDGKNLKMCHSVQSIAKPEAKSKEVAQKEIEEAMSQVKEAHNSISAAIDPMIGMLSKDKRSRSRGRSTSRSRKSRSRSRGRSRRSRSRSRKRSRSRHRRSRSRHRRRSRSRSRRRSRSKERRRKSRSRHRSVSRSRRDRSRSRSRRSRSRSRDRRDRSRSRHRKRKHRSRDRKRSRSRSRSKRSKSRSSRAKSRSKSKSRSSKSKYSDKSRDEKDRRSKDKSDGKKSDRESREREREKKSSKKDRVEKESRKSEDKSRASSEYSDKEKDKQDSEN